MKPLESCVKNYASKCLTKSETKSSISVLSYGVTKTNKGYCTNNKRKQAFIKMVACVTKHKTQMDKAMWKMASEFKAIADITPDKKMKIPLACWYGLLFAVYCFCVI